MELTPTDRHLLAALAEDSRQTVSTLAHRLGVSRATAKARIERLVENGTIRRFTILTRTEEDPVVRAIMTVELTGSLSRQVIQAMRAVPGVVALYSTNGSWDLVAELRADSLREFDRILRDVRSISGVINSETSILLDSVL